MAAALFTANAVVVFPFLNLIAAILYLILVTKIPSSNFCFRLNISVQAV